MAIPETDLQRIQKWCRERVPEHLRPQLLCPLRRPETWSVFVDS